MQYSRRRTGLTGPDLSPCPAAPRRFQQWFSERSRLLLHNDSCRFDCIGEGKLKLQKIGDIIKINEAQILINVNNNHCIIYERKNVISEKLKENLLHIIKNKKEDNSSNDGILGESEVILNNEENSINISNNINIIINDSNNNNNLFN